MAVQFVAHRLDDGRFRVGVLDLDAPQNRSNPTSYVQVRNIDGSNRLMREDPAFWGYIPREWEEAAHAAIWKAKGKPYPWPQMIPDWAII